MDSRVIISPRALLDLKELVQYISKDKPPAARRFGEKLLQAAESLAQLPERGRIVPELDDGITRESWSLLIELCIATTRTKTVSASRASDMARDC